jgi:hypothetical protein
MRNGKTLVAMVAITASLLLTSVAPAALVIDEFNDEDYSAWTPITNMQNIGEHADGYFYGENTTADPLMVLNVPDFAVGGYTHFEIRMSHEAETEGTVARIFWQRTIDTGFVGKFIIFPVTTDGEYHTYNVDVSGHASWNGTIDLIRLDPIEGVGLSVGRQFKVDYIRVVPEPATMVLLGLGGVGLLIRRRRRA